jgi:hypothetical protein
MQGQAETIIDPPLSQSEQDKKDIQIFIEIGNVFKELREKISRDSLIRCAYITLDEKHPIHSIVTKSSESIGRAIEFSDDMSVIVNLINDMFRDESNITKYRGMSDDEQKFFRMSYINKLKKQTD